VRRGEGDDKKTWGGASLREGKKKKLPSSNYREEKEAVTQNTLEASSVFSFTRKLGVSRIE